MPGPELRERLLEAIERVPEQCRPCLGIDKSGVFIRNLRAAQGELRRATAAMASLTTDQLFEFEDRVNRFIAPSRGIVAEAEVALAKQADSGEVCKGGISPEEGRAIIDAEAKATGLKPMIVAGSLDASLALSSEMERGVGIAICGLLRRGVDAAKIPHVRRITTTHQ